MKRILVATVTALLLTAASPIAAGADGGTGGTPDRGGFCWC